MVSLLMSAFDVWQSLQDETKQSQRTLMNWARGQYGDIGLWMKNRYNAALARTRMTHARSFEEWKLAAVEIDRLEGKDAWKKKPDSKLYDFELLKCRRDYLRSCRERGDVAACADCLRSGLVRNLGGSANPVLYQQTFVGTKTLIEEYQDEVEKCLRMIAQDSHQQFSLPERLAFFTESRHAYGRTALLLSGGAGLGMYHLGVVKTLFEQRLLPRVVAGSSAGALVAALICTTVDEELPKIFQKSNLKYGPFDDISKKGSLQRKLFRLLKKGVLMDVTVLQKFVRANIGDVTFQEAYDKTQRVLNITVTGYGEHDGHRLLNYLTAPNVLIWSAAVASCSIPFFYEPAELLAKDRKGNIVPYHPSGLPNLKFVDGSIACDLPMVRLSELFNVNQFIVSQTNPWVIPFLSSPTEQGLLPWLLYSELKFRCTQLMDLGVLPKALSRFVPLVTQEYRGHVTIWPACSLRDYRRILSNPSEEDIQRCILHGARRTWPKVTLMRTLSQIEQTLDQCVVELRRKMMLLDHRLSCLRPLAPLPDIIKHVKITEEGDEERTLAVTPVAERERDRALERAIDSQIGSPIGSSNSSFGYAVPRNLSFNIPRTPSGNLNLMMAVAATVSRASSQEVLR